MTIEQTGMNRANPQSRVRAVVLVNLDNVVVAHLTTDREDFEPIATWGRDRIFLLAGEDADGAIYAEVPAWRISLANLDSPKPRKRRRKSATIIKFQGRTT